MIKLLFVLLFLPLTASHSFVTDTTNYTPTEILIINRIEAGEVADLFYNYTNEGNKVKFGFLEALLTNKIKGLEIPPNGIFIRNAEFVPDMQIQYTNIPLGLHLPSYDISFSIRLENCTFNEEVVFYNARIRGDFSLRGSIFIKEVNLNSLSVDHSLNISNAKFYDKFNMVNCFIRSQLSAKNAEFLNKTKVHDFSGLNVGNSIFFQNSKFNSLTLFKNITVGLNLEMNKAEFNGKLYFDASTVRGSVFLSNSKFNDKARFISFTTNNQFHLDSCHFKQEVTFNSANVQHAYFDYSIFENEVDFGNFTTEGILKFENVSLIASTKKLYFRNLKIGSHASLLNSEIYGSIDFGASVIGGSLNLGRCKFYKKANFNSVSVKGNLILNEAKFLMQVNFIGSKVLKQTQMHYSIFNNEAIFQLMESSGLSITNSNFHSESDFSFIKAKIINIDSSRFSNELSVISFNGANIGHVLSIENSIMNAWLDLRGTSIGGSINIKNVAFNNSVQTVATNLLHVKKSFNVSKSTFFSEVIISNCKIEGNMLLDSLQIKNNLKFDFVDVSNSLGIKNLVIDNIFDISNSAISYLKVDSIVCKQMNIYYTNISELCNLNRVKLNRFFIKHFKLGGRLNLGGIDIKEYIEFEDCNVNSVSFNNLILPLHKDSIFIGGLNYKTISYGSNNSFESILNLLDNSRFDINAYTNYENYLKSIGDISSADKVYILRKKAEDEEESNPIIWLLSKIYFGTINYGKNPEWALYWSSFFIVLGIIVFPVKKMELKSDSNKVLKYNRLLYSFDLFIPIISFGFDNSWQPKQNGKFRHIYAHIHKVLGWFLISMVIIAISGLIK